MGRYISTTGTAGVSTKIVSTTHQAAVNERILANSSSGTFTITLPANASLLVNDTIQIIDANASFGTNAVTVARNSSLNCNFQQITDLMDNLPKEVGLLLDLGHMNISSKIMDFDRYKFLDQYLSKYGDRLYEVHISENKRHNKLNLQNVPMPQRGRRKRW